jgi:hypothetical protein
VSLTLIVTVVPGLVLGQGVRRFDIPGAVLLMAGRLTRCARDGNDQAMTGLPRELRDLIESGPIAHLSTVNPEGLHVPRRRVPGA